MELQKFNKLTKKTIANCLGKMQLDHSILIDTKTFDKKVDLLFEDCQMMSDEQFKEVAEKLRKGELYGKLPSSKDFLQIGTVEVRSPKEIWAEKILKSNKPADYEQVMRVANIEADYKYFENDNFYFLAESDEIKEKCKDRVKEIELELFKLTNNQCQVFIISKNYFNGK
jgi:hypothetical protein